MLGMDTRDNGEDDVLLDAMLGIVAARDDSGGASPAETALAAQCVRLRGERDALRRDVCEIKSAMWGDHLSAADVARGRGWDGLYPEPKPSP